MPVGLSDRVAVNVSQGSVDLARPLVEGDAIRPYDTVIIIPDAVLLLLVDLVAHNDSAFVDEA